MVIDDEKDFLEIISRTLKAAGLNVALAESGEEGLRQMQTLKPDLVLLDMQMPGMSGADLIARAKENKDLKNIKIVFVSSVGTARKSAEDARMAKAIGAIGYIDKSNDLDRIVSEIRSYL